MSSVEATRRNIGAASLTQPIDYILSLTCTDRPGLVANIAGALFALGANIVESQQFNDRLTGRFFLRVVFECGADPAYLEDRIESLQSELNASCTLKPKHRKTRALILVSRFDHCLGDLLYRVRVGEIDMDIAGIVCNHPRDALTVSAIGDLPFHHLPVTRETKFKQEAQIKALIEQSGADLVILARYMQILSDDMVRHLEGRCINIHHSFLPGFKGAKPYHQAHARGVKMIGATAHYVTADLDEGPIIIQDVEHITHADMPEELVAKGRNIEQRVLAKAVKYHIEQRVLRQDNSTIVFGA